MKFALGIAKQSDSSIIGLNVHSHSMFVKTSIVKQKSQEIIQQAKQTSQKVKVPFLGVIKVSDNVGRMIITFAKSHKVDMIIIGSRGPDPYHEVFLGSVANYLVNKSKIPVTIVK